MQRKPQIQYYIFTFLLLFFFNRVILLYNHIIYELHKHSTNSYTQTSYRSKTQTQCTSGFEKCFPRNHFSLENIFVINGMNVE